MSSRSMNLSRGKQSVSDKFSKSTPDAIIAATALVHGLTLVSRNIQDFQSIPKLKRHRSMEGLIQKNPAITPGKFDL
ncbi:putative toxin-antitoxin system, toxin component, PIN family [Leptospira alstonii serovar Pingchang str. 80-412]|uniref:Toxin-antitoxin system, toxin component, PIN family n=1 Tax=Leptospira alstonii serovar Pingchang str. 80-412 TaxID=1218564 RepID=T0FY26_9LEPT|nr:putative toxin-antitoxin system, toxin component, PIN family [Leptospira alstonii serovar Pingchang str. 80-412]